MKTLNTVVMMLLIIGGLNWGFVGLFEFDLVKAIFGQGVFARFIYTVVGLSAIGQMVIWNTGETQE